MPQYALNERSGGGRHQTEHVHMGHHIMTAALLLLAGKFELLLVQAKVLTHLRDRLVRDRQTEFLLGDCQVQPQLTPGAEPPLSG